MEQSPISPLFQRLGALLLLGGILGAAYYFFAFDTTVATGGDPILGQSSGGNRVHNIGLLVQRQNGLILSIAAVVVGAILFSVGHFISEQSKQRTAAQPPQPKLCLHCGKYHAETSAFCAHCGKPISQTESEPTPSARPEPPKPPPAPPPVPVPAPVAKAPPASDYDDNLPMPISPPPPARPKVVSILDDGGFEPSAAKPQAAAPAKPPMPSPPKPAPPAVPKPPAPAAPAAHAPTMEAKPAGEGCPTCKRVAPGRPGARYCMMCDKPY